MNVVLTKIFWLLPSEGYREAWYRSDVLDPSGNRYEYCQQINVIPLRKKWKVPPREWEPQKRRPKPQPTAIHDGTGLILRREDALALFGEFPLNVELLEQKIDDEDWVLVNSLNHSNPPTLEASDLLYTEYPGDPRRCAYKVHWVTIVDSSAHAFDIFTPRHWDTLILATESFVDRFNARKIQGVEFIPVGQIVSDLQYALPAPPKEPPKPLPPPRRRPASLTLTAWAADRTDKLAADAQVASAELGEGLDADPERLIAAMAARHIESTEGETGLEPPAPARSDMERAAALYAALFVRHLQWTPADVMVRRKAVAWAVRSPDGHFALCPSLMIERAMENADASGFLLTFKMIQRGDLPPGGVGVTWIGGDPRGD
jgi:hypothetical protein